MGLGLGKAFGQWLAGDTSKKQPNTKRDEFLKAHGIKPKGEKP